MSDIFEKIIDGSIPSTCIYQDDFVYSFLDINPKSKGHCLVIPKIHIDNILDFNEQQRNDFFTGLTNTLTTLKEQYNFEEYNIVTNNGTKAGQEVFHLHFHIIPRY